MRWKRLISILGGKGYEVAKKWESEHILRRVRELNQRENFHPQI
jgi:hypothetical protein